MKHILKKPLDNFHIKYGHYPIKINSIAEKRAFDFYRQLGYHIIKRGWSDFLLFKYKSEGNNNIYNVDLNSIIFREIKTPNDKMSLYQTWVNQIFKLRGEDVKITSVTDKIKELEIELPRRVDVSCSLIWEIFRKEQIKSRQDNPTQDKTTQHKSNHFPYFHKSYSLIWEIFREKLRNTNQINTKQHKAIQHNTQQFKSFSILI